MMPDAAVVWPANESNPDWTSDNGGFNNLYMTFLGIVSLCISFDTCTHAHTRRTVTGNHNKLQ